MQLCAQVMWLPYAQSTSREIAGRLARVSLSVEEKGSGRETGRSETLKKLVQKVRVTRQ
jgi:hypothetical protein